MASRQPHDELNEKTSELDEPSQSPLSESESLSSQTTLCDWDNYGFPQPRVRKRQVRKRQVRKRHVRFARRPRRLAAGRRSEGSYFKFKSAGEERREIFIGISHASCQFLVQCLSALESIQSPSATSSPSALLTGMELAPLSTTESNIPSLEEICWQLDSLVVRLASWQAYFLEGEWLRIFEGRGNLLEVRNEMSSSLLCLVENEIILFEQATLDVIKTDTVLQEIVRELSSLASEGKTLQLNIAVSESDTPETTGDLGAITQCIVRLEDSLPIAKQSLMPRMRPLSQRKLEPLISHVSIDCTYEFPSNLSLVITTQFSASSTSHLGERRMSPTPSTSHKIPRLQSPSLLGSPTTVELEETGSRFDLLCGECVFERLQKLVSLKDLWEKAKPAQDVNSLMTDVPPFATVVFSTDLSVIERFPLELDEINSKPAQQGDDNIDMPLETMTEARSVDESLPDDIAEELVDKTFDEYLAILDLEQVSYLLPGFSYIYAKMESSLVLLESLSGWILYAQPSYLDNVMALLPIIHCCLLDRLFETCSELLTELQNSDASRTPDLHQTLCTIRVLCRFIERLISIEISPSLKMEWDRLQQPLQEIRIELDSLLGDLARRFTYIPRMEENNEEDATTQQTQQEEDDDSTQSDYDDDGLVLPGVMLPPLYLLFHFTHDRKESSEPPDKSTAPFEPFISSSGGKLMTPRESSR